MPFIENIYTCGYYGEIRGDKSGRCNCRPEQIKRYQEKLSGPLLDRIDLHITVPALPASDLQSATLGESSASVRERVIKAFDIQQARQAKSNNELTASELAEFAPLTEAGMNIMAMAQQRLNLSARGYHRVLRVARTIADLAGSQDIDTPHLTEALSYRGN